MNATAATHRWKVPARELSDAELDDEYRSACEKFDSRGEHGGSPGEFWAERMDEITNECERRRLPLPIPSQPEQVK